MAHRRQVPRRHPADTLRRRVGTRELRMLALERLELAKQLVIFGVGDLGRILDVVQAVMTLELGAQPLDPLARRHEKTRSASALPGSMPQPASLAPTASSSRPIAARAPPSSSRPAPPTTPPPPDPPTPPPAPATAPQAAPRSPARPPPTP